MKIDLDMLERTAKYVKLLQFERETDAQSPDWGTPGVALALISRIRELEAVLRLVAASEELSRIIRDGHLKETAPWAITALLEKGAVLP